MKALAYYRVSTLDQTKKNGLAYQQRTVQDLCKRKGYTLVEEFTEPGVSGLETLDRPAMGRLRARIRAGGINLVVAYDGDRLSRKLLHKLLFQEELTEAGIGLDYVTGTPDLTTPDGIANDQQKGVDAQREAGKIRARTMQGRHQAALEAEQKGHAKFLGGPFRLAMPLRRETWFLARTQRRSRRPSAWS